MEGEWTERQVEEGTMKGGGDVEAGRGQAATVEEVGAESAAVEELEVGCPRG